MTNKQPVYLRISAPGISALLDSEDGGFRVELQRAVVAEVVRRLFAADINESLTAIIRDEIQKSRKELFEVGAVEKEVSKVTADIVNELVKTSQYSWTNSNLSKAKKDLIYKAIEKSIIEQVGNMIEEKSGMMKEAVDTKAESIFSRIDNVLEIKIQQMVNIKVAEKINNGVTSRLAELVQKLGN